MVSSLNSWVQSIILAIIIVTIIEIILPEGNNKKYVKTIIGIYIIFVMLEPIISQVLNKKINIYKMIDDTTSQMSEYGIDELKLETDIYIEQSYSQKIKEDIKQKIEEKGYTTDYLSVDIETENNENFGTINQIILNISKTNEIEENSDDYIVENTINNVEVVEIKIANTKSIKKDNSKNNVSTDEIEKLIGFLNSEYGTYKENIHINE